MLSLEEWKSKLRDADGFDIAEKGDEFIFSEDPYLLNRFLEDLPEGVKNHGRVYIANNGDLIYFYRSAGTIKFPDEYKAKITNFLQFTDSEFVMSERPFSFEWYDDRHLRIYCNDTFKDTNVIEQMTEGSSLGFLTLKDIGYSRRSDYEYEYTFGIEENIETVNITYRLGYLLKQNDSMLKLNCPRCEQKSVDPIRWEIGYKCENCYLPIPKLNSFEEYVDLTEDSYEEIVEKYRSVFEESIEVNDSNWFTKLRGEHIRSTERAEVYRADYNDEELIVVFNNVAMAYSINNEWGLEMAVDVEQCSLCDNTDVEAYDPKLYGIGEWGGHKMNEPVCSDCIDVAESAVQIAIQKEMSGEVASRLL